ncbi:MAG: CCA tRNA nucleotidyltransferase [Gemmatimonadota bacterium]
MMDFRLQAPPAVRWIVATLEKVGHETWAVGGAVRDAAAGLPGGDWDLATHARPREVRRIFKRTVPLGVEHGTVGVLADDGKMYEVTTFRRDVETDGRHAVVEFAETIHEDLARRDFTINAVAWHPLREKLLDPYHGLADLRAGVLRTVGDPRERFAEDYLRILRAFRFAGRFSLEIEATTWAAIVGAVDHLCSLSAERIRDELLKVLADDPRPSRVLEMYRESGALAVLYPEVAAAATEGGGAGWRKRLTVVDALPLGEPFLRLAALLRGLPAEDAARVLVRLRLSNAQTDRVAHLASAPPTPGPDAEDEEIRRWLSAVGRDHVRGVLRLDLAAARAGVGAPPREAVAACRAVRRVMAARPPLAVPDLKLDGRDLIRMGLKPGPRFGELLEELLDLVLEDPSLNRKEILEAEVRRRVGEAEEGGTR